MVISFLQNFLHTTLKNRYKYLIADTYCIVTRGEFVQKSPILGQMTPTSCLLEIIMGSNMASAIGEVSGIG